MISLDFELMWGVRDKFGIDRFGDRILGGREAIPRMLEMFEVHGIRATWATVGLLFCRDRLEMAAAMPSLRPTYEDPTLDNYGYFDEVGGNEAEDRYYHGRSLLERVAATPGQEIATHTFSHYYCLEAGQTREQLRADLEAAKTVAEPSGFTLRSIVLPRNQYDEATLDVCREAGLTHFRGNESHRIYRPSSGREQTLARRAVRLTDSYLNLTGHHTGEPRRERGLVNVPSSRFLRSHTRRDDVLERLRARRITASMTAAAAAGGTFHLWWHPHDFGRHTRRNLGALGALLRHYEVLKDRFGMTSRAMCEVQPGT